MLLNSIARTSASVSKNSLASKAGQTSVKYFAGSLCTYNDFFATMTFFFVATISYIRTPSRSTIYVTIDECINEGREGC